MLGGSLRWRGHEHQPPSGYALGALGPDSAGCARHPPVEVRPSVTPKGRLQAQVDGSSIRTCDPCDPKGPNQGTLQNE